MVVWVMELLSVKKIPARMESWSEEKRRQVVSTRDVSALTHLDKLEWNLDSYHSCRFHSLRNPHLRWRSWFPKHSKLELNCTSLRIDQRSSKLLLNRNLSREQRDESPLECWWTCLKRRGKIKRKGESVKIRREGFRSTVFLLTSPNVNWKTSPWVAVLP